MSADPFCPHCGVTMDLHDDDGPDSCGAAEHKARMLDMFNRFLWDVVGGPR